MSVGVLVGVAEGGEVGVVEVPEPLPGTVAIVSYFCTSVLSL